MNEDMKKLIDNFKAIASKRWIEGVSGGTGSIGLTFEKELGKNVDSVSFPDYEGIEIKCAGRYSGFPIGLFSVSFDGPSLDENKRIGETYGYFDNDIPDKKILVTSINCKDYTIVNKKYKFRLELDEDEDKLYIAIYDLSNNLIEKETFVTLNNLKWRLVLKLSKLAFVRASIKRVNTKTYFRYYKMTLYELISYQQFLNLLKEGIISTVIMLRIGKSGINKGKYKNKSLFFQLRKQDINLLFKEIYRIDYDEEYNFNPFVKKH